MVMQTWRTNLQTRVGERKERVRLRTVGSPTIGASAMIEGSNGVLKLLGRVLSHLNQKTF